MAGTTASVISQRREAGQFRKWPPAVTHRLVSALSME